jgi:hypothetical protein
MTFLQFITYAGIFVFALTGAFKARSFKMDVFGGIVLAFVTAYGGGTLRDLFIGIRPVSWVNDNIALILVFAGTAFTFLLKENVNRFKRIIFYTDAIGLGLFTAWAKRYLFFSNGCVDRYFRRFDRRHSLQRYSQFVKERGVVRHCLCYWRWRLPAA